MTVSFMQVCYTASNARVLGSLLGTRGGDGLLNMSHVKVNILAFAIRGLAVKGRDLSLLTGGACEDF